jgi:UPF0755 protein
MPRWRSFAKVTALGVLLLLAAALFMCGDRCQHGTALAARGHPTRSPRAAAAHGAQRAARVQALRNPRLVEGYLRLHGKSLKAQAGVYQPATGASAGNTEQLSAGRVVLSQVTIVEGWDFAQMRQALRANTDLVHSQQPDDAAVMSELGLKGVAAEGRFFPDTYRFAAGTDRHIYEMALQRMNERLQQEAARAPNLPVRSPAHALILASVVERRRTRG